MVVTNVCGDRELSWMDAMGSDRGEDWMSEWSFSVSIMITAWRTGMERNVAQRDDASCSCVKMGWRLVGFMLV